MWNDFTLDVPSCRLRELLLGLNPENRETQFLLNGAEGCGCRNPVLRPVHCADGLRLDGDAPLAFQIHIVQDLRLHLTARQKACLLDNPIRQRGLSVIKL